MTWRRRSNRGLAAMMTLALVAGCSPSAPSPTPSPVTVPPTSPAPQGSAGPSPSAAEVKVPLARWSDCGKGFQCADVRVPSDYSATSKGYLNVAIIRLAATDRKARIGSLVINPGGPGASGVEFVREIAKSGLLSADLRKRFDIVGFDPRGVNSSTAIRCIDNLDPQARFDPSPDDPKELKDLVDSARHYAAECAKRNDATLPYLSTDAVARDLDGIRQAIGDKKLTYLGFSYGTLIGALYADRFPDRIRAMVLDGAIDPAIDLEQLRVGQAKSFEHALAAFLKDCAAKKSCVFHENGKSAAVFDSLMASIDAKSLPATRLKTSRRIGPSIASYAVLAALYDRESWPFLAASLELARHGDGSLMLLIADPYRGRKPNGSYSNLQDAYTANTCLDFAAPKDVAGFTAWAAALKKSAPHFAGLFAYNDLPCAFWPVPAERTPAPVRAAGAPPIVVVGSTGDPATPYPWAVSLAKELESGVLITRKGEGHTGYHASQCVQANVDAYLLDLKVPKDGLSCL
jgi:pimeloyl-ACP methyl ester carboxylesterase